MHMCECVLVRKLQNIAVDISQIFSFGILCYLLPLVGCCPSILVDWLARSLMEVLGLQHRRIHGRMFILFSEKNGEIKSFF